MTCVEAREHWMLYVDSEGDAELHLRIRNHLAQCPVCARWFSQEQWLEQQVHESLSRPAASLELWERVLSKSGLRRRRRLRLLLWTGLLAAGLLLAAFIGMQFRMDSSDPLRLAAAWHDRWQTGSVRPDLATASPEEIDRFLRRNIGPGLRCPPPGDNGFHATGVGMYSLAGRPPAAFLVGLLDGVPVSIFVFDSSALKQEKSSAAQMEGYQVVSGRVANQVVIFTGAAPPASLHRLLHKLREWSTMPDDFPRN